MDLIWLDDYRALADTLSFSRAAALRHVTQPAFSRRIRALEAWVGTPLFARTTHSVMLTAAGEHFGDQAEILRRALYQLRRDTLDVAGRARSQLQIAATHALSFTFFPAWVRRNESLLELGNLNLLSDSMSACEQMLLRGDVQFLLCHHGPGSAGAQLGATYLGLVVGRDVLVPLSAPGPDGGPLWRLNGTPPARYLAYSDRSGLARIVDARWHEVDREFGLKTVFRSHLAATLQSMVRAGEGLAWLPRTLAEDDIAAGRVVELGGPDVQIPVEIRLFRAAGRLTATAEAVWDGLNAQAEI
ncbi:LysR family transcriptional regulator [Phreatobacter aquaticus]|uniref:LysR family transcriptional regulator n=1 Tax=Phreatobacter aquaticus TaxID=2570229 RepID=A0A4D7QJH3_9HYPH|nr:LysR family transcriptional regulator [Phreatobacter aquaticus]QCK86791.1 LysR family transcriptional regulator [Phreatobacter aquaticus]